MEAQVSPQTVALARGPLGAVQEADREIARQTALRARALAEFAATRPASVDRQPGQPGAMSPDRLARRSPALADVSEWAVQELVVALSITPRAAEDLLVRSLDLVHRLPRTLTALEAGEINVGHLWPMLEKVAPIADADIRGEVEGDLLAWAVGRVTTPAQLGAKARRVVLARDARGAAQRLTAALRRRGAMWIRPDETDGMAVLSVLLTVPEARALMDALARYADALDDDAAENGPDGAAHEPRTSVAAVPRTRAEKTADVLLDLVLRGRETDLPPVQAKLTMVAPVITMAGADGPGEVDGQPVPAEMVRSLARALGLLSDDPAGIATPASTDQAAVEPSAPMSPAAPATLDDPGWEQAELERWLAEVEDRVLAEPWGGAEAPPPEELAAYWARELAWAEQQWSCDVEESGPPRDPLGDERPPDQHPGERAAMSSGWWAAADEAMEAVGEAMLTVDRALSRARGAVQRAELAEADDESAWQAGAAGRLTAAEDAITGLAALSAPRRAQLADLLDATGGGGLVDRPRIAVTDALTGALLALTDSRELRAAAAAGQGLGPPGPSGAYRPGAALDRYLRARDRRCRFPGCRNRVPVGGELDHNVPWPEGATSAENLNGFCTSHHRGKHQAPGWEYELAPDGTLTVTTPSGVVATTSPPPY